LSSIKKIKLFASCIPVKGAERSLICDLQRNRFDFIPNDLCEILILHEGKSTTEIKYIYNNLYDEIIDEYIDFLLEKEYVFFTHHPNWFPKMGLQWQDPFRINNAIIDVGENFEFEKILFELNSLKCKAVEFRFYDWKAIQIVNDILNYVDLKKSIISSVGFVLHYSEETTEHILNAIISNNSRVAYFVITNSPKNNFIKSLSNNVGYIIYTKDVVNDSTHCGLITNMSLVINTKLFTESQHHNTCLNRKISIDKNGNIKNCPSMTESFGNIKDTTLEEALNHPNFKKYWHITKDQIEVCKDCEFRHICTDCRAYTENPEDQYSKPLKCGYDPYTNEWEEWSTNPLKQKAIEYYRLQGK